MHPRLFLAVFPALLGTIVPSLALPIQSSGSQSLDASSFDPSSDVTLQLSRDVAEELLFERYYQDEDASILARALGEEIYPRGKDKVKLTAEAAQARKDAVRADVAQKQADNVVKKAERKEAVEKLEGKNGRPHSYAVPKKVNYVKQTLPNGNEHIVKGYRAIEREKGVRVAKQPKTPHADFAPGEHLTNTKAVQSQKEANERAKLKKEEGRAKYEQAAKLHKEETLKHGNMPARTDEFRVQGQGVVTGKEVRQGAFNAAVHDGKPGARYPVEFRNQEQGPANNRHVPLPHMVGSGIEYPVQKDGYKPGDPIGTVRGVYQKTAAGGYNLQGVLAHDNTRDRNHPGFNDHMPVPVTHAPASPDPYHLEGSV